MKAKINFHGIDIFTSVTLKFSKSRVHILIKISDSSFKINQRNVRVFKTNPLHGIDIFTSVTLKFSKSRVHILIKISELFLTSGLNVCLFGLNNNTPLSTVL